MTNLVRYCSTAVRKIREVSFSVAPMMDYTDFNQRYLFRLISKRAVLYTEMITAPALVNTKDPKRFLESDLSSDEPIVLQLGGSDPKMMAAAARIAMSYGFKHFNVNCGCPSPKVAGSGQFGASLMNHPELVRDICSSISEVSGEVTTIKMRLGLDDQTPEEAYNFTANFVDIISRASSMDTTVCNHFIAHARKAILGKKLTPADNRRIPPLRYDLIHKLCIDFPNIGFTLNGGIASIDECMRGLELSDCSSAQDHFVSTYRDMSTEKLIVDSHHKLVLPSEMPSVPKRQATPLAGCMVGRACIDRPFEWSTIDSRIYGDVDPGLTRREILHKYAHHAASMEGLYGMSCRNRVIKPLLGLFAGEANGRLFRSQLEVLLSQGRTRNTSRSANSNSTGRLGERMSLQDIILHASEVLPEEVLDRLPMPLMNICKK
jgi:tRNA-dihydrouridine synthase A